MDSGASHLLLNNKELFTQLSTCTSSLTTASHKAYRPHGVGTASIDFQYTDGTWITLPFLQAFYDPNAPNLLSVRQMIRHGTRSPDFISLTLHHGASLFDLYGTGRDYVPGALRHILGLMFFIERAKVHNSIL